MLRIWYPLSCIMLNFFLYFFNHPFSPFFSFLPLRNLTNKASYWAPRRQRPSATKEGREEQQVLGNGRGVVQIRQSFHPRRLKEPWKNLLQNQTSKNRQVPLNPRPPRVWRVAQRASKSQSRQSSNPPPPQVPLLPNHWRPWPFQKRSPKAKSSPGLGEWPDISQRKERGR